MPLTDPHIPVWSYGEAGAIDNAGSVASVAWPIANTAVYVPVQFGESATLYSISYAANSGTGNYDLGFYDDALARIASTGSTALSAAGVKTLSLPEYAVQPGAIYYGALAHSSTGAVIRMVIANIRDMIGVGCGIEASALPLPVTATPVTVSTGFGGVMPIFAFGVR